MPKGSKHAQEIIFFYLQIHLLKNPFPLSLFTEINEIPSTSYATETFRFSFFFPNKTPSNFCNGKLDMLGTSATPFVPTNTKN